MIEKKCVFFIERWKLALATVSDEFNNCSLIDNFRINLHKISTESFQFVKYRIQFGMTLIEISNFACMSITRNTLLNLGIMLRFIKT